MEKQMAATAKAISLPMAQVNLANNKIEALRALAMLLLREIEAVEESLPESTEHRLDEEICLSDEVERYEIDLIRHALLRNQGNQRKAARVLGVKTTTLNAKMKKYGIEAISLGRLSELKS